MYSFAFSVGVQVTSTGPQTIKKPQGADIILGCSYNESPSDTGQLDVEWSIVSPDMTQKDKLVRNNSLKLIRFFPPQQLLSKTLPFILLYTEQCLSICTTYNP